MLCIEFSPDHMADVCCVDNHAYNLHYQYLTAIAVILTIYNYNFCYVSDDVGLMI